MASTIHLIHQALVAQILTWMMKARVSRKTSPKFFQLLPLRMMIALLAKFVRSLHLRLMIHVQVTKLLLLLILPKKVRQPTLAVHWSDYLSWYAENYVVFFVGANYDCSSPARSTSVKRHTPTDKSSTPRAKRCPVGKLLDNLHTGVVTTRSRRKK